MVLDEASPTGGTFADDSSPSSDRDSYSSDGGSSPGGVSSIDFSALPKPMPFFGPLAGYTQANQVSSIHAICRGHALALQRPLTGPEAQCIAYYLAKRDSISSWGVPIGAAIGMYRATRVHGTLRMPFYNFQEPQFSLQKFGPYSGARAQMLWRLAQKLLYTSMGAFFGKSLFVMYAVSVTVNGQRKDPRMKEIIENTIAIGPREAMKRAEQGYVAGGGRPPSGSQGGSPQNTADGYGEMESRQNAGVLMDQDVGAAERQQQYDFNQSSQQNSSPAYSRDLPTSRSTAFDFDDASPTAQSSQQQPQQSMNAWERLRRGQGPPPQQRPSQSSVPSSPPSSESGGNAWAKMRGDNTSEQRSRQTGEESFSYSSSERDSQLAKEEAQRDFDARVERERQGKDFDDSVGNKRWS